MTHPPHDGPHAKPQEPTPGGQDEPNPTPHGAIAVTLFLAATILVFWFGMYALNLARS